MASAGIYQTSMGIAVGLVIALFLGMLVGPLLGVVDNKTKPPDPRVLPKDIWDVVLARAGSGPILGVIEQSIFFIAFWSDGWPLLASWLAFKVASKWQSWTHVAQLPAPPPADDLRAVQEYVILRHKWVARRYMTFMIGTGANILLAAFGVAIGKAIAMYG
jgi:hypothetical protein